MLEFGAMHALTRITQDLEKLSILSAKSKAYNQRLRSYIREFETGTLGIKPVQELRRMRASFAIGIQDFRKTLKIIGKPAREDSRTRKKIAVIKRLIAELEEKLKRLDILIAERGE